MIPQLTFLLATSSPIIASLLILTGLTSRMRSNLNAMVDKSLREESDNHSVLVETLFNILLWDLIVLVLLAVSALEAISVAPAMVRSFKIGQGLNLIWVAYYVILRTFELPVSTPLLLTLLAVTVLTLDWSLPGNPQICYSWIKRRTSPSRLERPVMPSHRPK